MMRKVFRRPHLVINGQEVRGVTNEADKADVESGLTVDLYLHFLAPGVSVTGCRQCPPLSSCLAGRKTDFNWVTIQAQRLVPVVNPTSGRQVWVWA